MRHLGQHGEMHLNPLLMNQWRGYCNEATDSFLSIQQVKFAFKIMLIQKSRKLPPTTGQYFNILDGIKNNLKSLLCEGEKFWDYSYNWIIFLTWKTKSVPNGNKRMTREKVSGKCIYFWSWLPLMPSLLQKYSTLPDGLLIQLPGPSCLAVEDIYLNVSVMGHSKVVTCKLQACFGIKLRRKFYF